MTLRRSSENFEAIRAKFEGSKQKCLSKPKMKAVKETSTQSVGLNGKDGKRKPSQPGDIPTETRSSTGRIKRLSSMASLGTLNAFSSNPFQRRKHTDGGEASEQIANNTVRTADFSASLTSKLIHILHI